MSRPQPQTGFSLIELMVAMLLGLLITAAAVSLFTTNQRAFQLQQGQSKLQQQGRLAMRFMTADIRKTGFSDSSVSSPISPGVQVGAGNSEEGGNGDSDQLVIAYDGKQDCEGNPVATTTNPLNTLPRQAVVNKYWRDDDGNLKCKGSLTAGSNGVILLRNVRSFQVLYGVDTAPGDHVAFAGKYVHADEIGSQVVLSVKLALLLEDRINSLGNGGDKTYYLLDQDVVVDSSRTLYQPFTATVALRNYPWDAI